MGSVAGSAAGKFVQMLTAPTGLNSLLGELQLPPVPERQIFAQNVSVEIAERSKDLKYPVFHVYCRRLSNKLVEKFRNFSGEAELTVELRVSHDRLEELESRVQSYVDAVLQILDGSRGDWGDGIFYTGGYEAEFGPVKHGGKNFIQIATIRVAVKVSR